MTVTVFGHLILINIYFNEFLSPFSPSFLFRLRRYIKHSGQCFTGYSITSNFVRNTPPRVVSSTLFSVLGYPDDTSSLVLDILHEGGATSRGLSIVKNF